MPEFWSSKGFPAENCAMAWENMKATGEVREYRKVATILARQVNEAFIVHTLEGTVQGQPGDYIAYGPHGDVWPIKKEIFEQTYVPV